MSITEKSKSYGDYYVTLRIENEYGHDFYHVCFCHHGRTFKENSYAIFQRKRALNLYYRYCGEAKREEEFDKVLNEK